MEKRQLRAQLFRHLDGLVTAPIAHALIQRGVLKRILQDRTVDLDALSEDFSANAGYLNVALRVLASQGFLDYNVDASTGNVRIDCNAKSEKAFGMFGMYQSVVEMLDLSGNFHPRKFEEAPFRKLQAVHREQQELAKKVPANEPERSLYQQILAHREGYIVGPTLVRLGMNGMFHQYFMSTSFRPEEFHKNSGLFRELLHILTDMGWFTEKDGHFRFTDKGFFFAKRASAYGVTVSYLPTFRKIEELIFGNADVLRVTEPGKEELHVDREMNVWGSGGAHSNYFKVVDEVIIDLFNRPIEEQPKGVLDMGCGNGAYLKHIFEVIEQRTLRGTMLEEHPLFLVGVDYNEAALRATRSTLIQADIWAKVIWGDISNPTALADDLREHYDMDLGDLLNVRTFLDHNRIWKEPTEVKNTESSSTGAFASRGKRLLNSHVEANLREHFAAWSPYLQRFGLLMIELHTVEPHLAAQNIGRTAATAYDATHGFSDQYIVEIEVLHKVCREVGLEPDMAVFRRYPDTDYATVSINLLRGKK